MKREEKPIDIECPVPDCKAPAGKFCKFPIPGAFAGVYDYLHVERKDKARSL